MLKAKKNTLLNIILPAIIGIELVILVIKMSPTSPAEIWQNIKIVVTHSNNWMWILLSMLFGYLGEALRGIRWVLLIKPIGYNVKTLDCINSVASGYMFNAGVPRSGEIARCTLLNKVSKTPISYLFGHVLMERLIDFIILGFCIFLCIVYKFNEISGVINEIFPDSVYSFFSMNILFIFLGIIFLFFIMYKLGYKFFSKEKMNFFKSLFQKVKAGFYAIKKVKKIKLFLLYTFSIWFCYFAMTYVCFFCFDSMSEFTIMDGVFIMTLGGIGMVMPTPSGMGSYHIAAMIGLGMLTSGSGFTTNIFTTPPHPDQLTFAFLVHTAQTIMILAMGFLGLILLNAKSGYNAKLN